MKPILRFAACAVLAMVASHAVAQSQSFGLFVNDEPLQAEALVQLSDGSVVITGTTPAAADSVLFTSYVDAYAVRMTRAGTVMWAKRLDAPGGDHVSQTTLFKTNDALFVGYSGYNDLTFYPSDGLLKLDYNGNLVKSIKSTSLTDYNYGGNRYAQLANGNVVMMRSLSNEFRVVCFDADLNVQWSRSVNPDPGTQKNPALSMCISDDGDIVVCGKSDNRLAITSLSPDGDFQFGYRYDNDALYLQGRNVHTVSDGFVVQGLYADYSSSYGLTQSFVCKVDLQGNIAWFRVLDDAFGSVYDFVITNGAVTADGHFIYSGTTTAGSTATGELDANGNVVWSRIGDGAQSNYYYYQFNCPLSLDGDNAVIVQTQAQYPYGSVGHVTFTKRHELANGAVCGFSSSSVNSVDASFDHVKVSLPASSATATQSLFTNAPLSVTDVTNACEAVEMCATMATGLVETEDATPFDISPNPAVDQIMISRNGASTELKIYNAIGELVLVQELKNGNTTVNVSELPSGMYIAVSDDSHQRVRKFTIQR